MLSPIPGGFNQRFYRYFIINNKSPICINWCFSTNSTEYHMLLFCQCHLQVIEPHFERLLFYPIFTEYYTNSVRLVTLREDFFEVFGMIVYNYGMICTKELILKINNIETWFFTTLCLTSSINTLLTNLIILHEFFKKIIHKCHCTS